MGLIVLIIIGYVIWVCLSGGSKPARHAKDKEFEDANFSLKDVDDDFNTF